MGVVQAELGSVDFRTRRIDSSFCRKFSQGRLMSNSHGSNNSGFHRYDMAIDLQRPLLHAGVDVGVGGKDRGLLDRRTDD